MRLQHLRLLGIALFLATFAAPAWGNDEAPGTLPGEMKAMAQDIHAYLKERHPGKTLIVNIDSDPTLGSTAAAGATKTLVDELRSLGIPMKSIGADLSCEGRYTLSGTSVLIETEIFERSRKLKLFDRKAFNQERFEITDPQSVLELAGATGELSTNAKLRAGDLEQAVTNPSVSLASKSRVNCGPSGKYGIEICRKEPNGEYVPVPVIDEDGYAFVELKQGDIYGVRVFNDTKDLAGVSLCIDGLNTFTFSDVPHYRKLGKVVVQPGDAPLLNGWHVTNGKVDTFLVETAAKSLVASRVGADALLPIDDTMGTITASFVLAVPAGTPLPKDDPGKLSFGTAAGPQADAKMTPVRVRFGVLRGTVTIRYNKLVADDLPPLEETAQGPPK